MRTSIPPLRANANVHIALMSGWLIRPPLADISSPTLTNISTFLWADISSPLHTYIPLLGHSLVITTTSRYTYRFYQRITERSRERRWPILWNNILFLYTRKVPRSRDAFAYYSSEQVIPLVPTSTLRSSPSWWVAYSRLYRIHAHKIQHNERAVICISTCWSR